MLMLYRTLSAYTMKFAPFILRYKALKLQIFQRFPTTKTMICPLLDSWEIYLYIYIYIW